MPSTTTRSRLRPRRVDEQSPEIRIVGWQRRRVDVPLAQVTSQGVNGREVRVSLDTFRDD